MRNLRTIGVAGTVAALLLTSTTALADDKPVNPRPLAGERQQVRADLKQGIKDVRQDDKAKIEDMRAKAQEKLGEIKDKAKQQLATKLADQFNHLNKTWTDHFTDVLNHLDAILVKVENKSAADKTAGKDTTATDNAVASAKTAMATARVAVQTQAAKSYVIDPATITSTSATSTAKGQGQLMKALRDAYNGLRKQLMSDLMGLRDGAVKDARNAVQTAVATVAPVRHDNEGNATSTNATSSSDGHDQQGNNN